MSTVARKVSADEEGDILQLANFYLCPDCKADEDRPRRVQSAVLHILPLILWALGTGQSVLFKALTKTLKKQLQKGENVRLRRIGGDMLQCPTCKRTYPVQESIFRQEIMERIFERYASDITAIAKQAAKRGFEDLDELKQRCFLGLHDAIEHWNKLRPKASFRTYLMSWLKKRAFESAEGSGIKQQRMPYCPDCSKGKRKKDKVRCHRLDAALAFCPKCGKKVPFKEAPNIIVDLDEPQGDKGNLSLNVVFASPEPEPDRLLEIREVKADLKEVLSKLPLNHQKVLECRYFQGLTLEETGAQLGGLSKERIRQIEEESLGTLRILLAGKSVYEEFIPTAPQSQTLELKEAS